MKVVNKQVFDVVIKDILEIDVKDLQNYDSILLGAYTWGDGELPDEFIDFYEEMDCLNLQGKMATAFGSCDSSYEHFGGAVDILIEKLEMLGSDIVLEGLKIEQSPTEVDKEKCIHFGKMFTETILKRGYSK